MERKARRGESGCLDADVLGIVQSLHLEQLAAGLAGCSGLEVPARLHDD